MVETPLSSTLLCRSSELTLLCRSSELTFRSEKKRDSYRRSTWPKCPGEICLSVGTVAPKIVRITVSQVPPNGKTLLAKAAKLQPFYSVRENQRRFKIRELYWLPSKTIANKVKRTTEQELKDFMSDDGFIFTNVPSVCRTLTTQMEGKDLVRHPHSARELWVTKTDPETSIDWDSYRPGVIDASGEPRMTDWRELQ